MFKVMMLIDFVMVVMVMSMTSSCARESDVSRCVRNTENAIEV